MSKHILITGASSGVGRALVIKLSSQEFNLSICGRNSTKMAQTLRDISNKACVYDESFCLSDKDKINDFVVAAEDKFGDVDILINCAGLNSSRTQAVEPNWNELEWMMKINFYAPLRFVELVLPSMLTNKEGVVLNVLSTTCLFSNSGTAQYSASKSALDTYSKVLRKELHRTGVKVLSLYPGGIDSDFRNQLRPEYLSPIDVADSIHNMIFTHSNVQIHDLVIRPDSENNFC
ncbi:MAG: SDR family NAD(P)-dependent oxidoreductase [Thalassotalea sp.]|nr:SDR family NAD(P)-dependent oxidoreductase [Thalassotalea sp.]